MFTGIIGDIGLVAGLKPLAADLSIYVTPNRLSLELVQLGDSIAVNGVCLTVSAKDQNGLWFDVSQESLSKTTFAHIALHDRVNLEAALTPSSALGGHMVSGHVDGIGEIVKRSTQARSEQFWVSVPAALDKYIAVKGSVCIDGVSLTVNNVAAAGFDVNIIPHTLEHTIFDQYQAGHKVNIEVDIIARYLEKLLDHRTSDSRKSVTDSSL